MFGGLRTGDLHALRWETLDSADGAFTWGTAPRCKTARPQRLVIPEMLRPILRDWWERKGRPSEGFVFPNLRSGKRARAGSTGREGSGLSHAEAFRTDLRRAFGIDKLTEERVEVPDRRCAAGKRPVVKRRWKQARELTARERELLTATEHTRPVDFHSWRRAFV